jgi:regulator of sigma E protease
MPLALPLDPLAALTFIGLLVTLLTFHEAGRALVARGYGVAVLEFGLGIPPRLVGVARARGRWHVVWAHAPTSRRSRTPRYYPSI